MAAKRTGELIPLCHPLAIESVEVEFDLPDLDIDGKHPLKLRIKSVATITAKTGVEMEALAAVFAAASPFTTCAKPSTKPWSSTASGCLRKPADALGESRDGVFGIGFVFDQSRSVEPAFFQSGDDTRQVEITGAHHLIAPLPPAIEDEVFIMHAINPPGEFFANPFDRVPRIRPDLHAPRGVERDADVLAA